MSQPRSISTPAIILKRTNVGETDRILTLLTETKGKIAVIAKGCRKMSSSKRGYLEPGNLINAYLIPTKSLPILTQARLQEEFVGIKSSLQGMKKLFQVLEIVDTLLVEEENPEIFADVLSMVYHLNESPDNYRSIQTRLENLITSLGFQHPRETTYRSITDYVQAVAEKPLRSYEFLTVKK